jgi:trk system potassium uptake protein TrkA
VAVVVCLAAPVAYSHIRPMEAGRHRKFVVVGAGRLGRELIERLVAHGHPVVVVEAMMPQKDKLLTEGLRVVIGDATQRFTLEQARLSKGDVLIAVTGSDLVNRKVCLMARDEFKVDRLVARDNNPANTEDFRAEGIVPMNLYHSAAVVLESLATRPAVFHLVTEMAEGRDLFEVEVSCPGGCDVPLRKLTLPGTARLVMIRRDDEMLVPTGDTILEAGDLITVFGTDSEREGVEQLLGDEEGDEEDGRGAGGNQSKRWPR